MSEDHFKAARIQMARVLRNARTHFRKSMPEHWRLMVRSVRRQLYQATADCETLDNLRLERGGLPLHMEACIRYDHPDVRAAIYYRAYNELRSTVQGKTPASKAVTSQDPDRVMSKIHLEEIRETLRDERSIAFALEFHSDNIRMMAARGHAVFFVDLGDLLRKHQKTPLKRSLPDWIARAWLPLCLWECDKNGREAHTRCCVAADLLGLEFPAASDDAFFHQFVTAWHNTRTRKMK